MFVKVIFATFYVSKSYVKKNLAEMILTNIAGLQI